MVMAAQPPLPGHRAAGGSKRASGTIAGTVFILTSAGSHAASVAFHLIAAAVLGPARYGALGALVVLLGWLAVPVIAVQTLLTAEVVRCAERGTRPNPAAVMRWSLVAGGAGAVLVLAASPVMAGYLHLDSAWPLVFVAACCVPMAAGVVPWAVLCGQRRFTQVGTASLVTAALRVLLAAAFLAAGLGVTGALAGSLCAESARTALLCWWARSRGPGGDSPLAGPKAVIDARGAATATGAMAGLQVLLGVDAVLAQHLLPADQAGRYVAATTACRFVFFAAQLACTLSLPRFGLADPARSRRALLGTITVAAGLGLAATGGLAIAAPVALSAAFGASFRVPTALLLLRGLATTGLGLLWVVTQYLVSRRRQGGQLVTWLAVLTTVAAGMSYHPDPVGLALATTVGLGLSGVVLARLLTQTGAAR